MRFLSALFVTLLLAAPPTSRAATAVLLDSDRGDYIGAGQQYRFAAPAGTVTVLSATTTRISLAVSQGTDYFSLDFEAPEGSTLSAPGSFAGAVRYPFNSPKVPGLSVFGNGRGCNTLTGWFEVREAIFTTAGQLARMAIDFRQNCEGGPDALYGAVRINSELALAVPALEAIAGGHQFALPRDVLALDGRSSFARPASALSYRWTQLSGPPVDIDGARSDLAIIHAPLVRPGGEDLRFRLVVRDAAGNTSSDETLIRVASFNDPQTYVQMRSDAGDYIGGGASFRLDPFQGSFYNTVNFRGGLSVFYQGNDFYTLDFGPPLGTPFTAGAYENAQRFAFADPGRPGLDISGAGRGCNTVTGRFDVLDFQAVGDTVQRAAIDFEQHCEGASAALRGELRINYVRPGAPVANAGNDSSVRVGANALLDGSASTDNHGIALYRWRQLSGPAVSLTGADTARARFVAPTVTAATLAVFELLVADSEDLVAVDTVTVTLTPVPGSDGGGNGSTLAQRIRARLEILRQRIGELPRRP